MYLQKIVLTGCVVLNIHVRESQANDVALRHSDGPCTITTVRVVSWEVR